MEGIEWMDKVKNVELLRRIGEHWKILQNIKRRKMNLIGH